MFRSSLLAAVLIGISAAMASDVRTDDPALLSAKADSDLPPLDEQIRAGRRHFEDTWSLRNDVDGVWGLGPTYNEAACPRCHSANGRSAAPRDGGEVERGMVIRLSIPGTNPQGGPNPHPDYGDQLQNRGIAARVPREGQAIVTYRQFEFDFDDGEKVLLRKPEIEFRNLQFGDLGSDTMVSARSAPALFGLGLLEAVPDDAILAQAERQASLGLRGHPNRVWDVEAGRPAIGRFGWKANQPNLRQQIAAALLNDIGATSSLFPVDNCPAVQTACRSDPTTTNCGGAEGGCSGTLVAEVLPSRLRTMTLYVQSLALPDRPGPAAAIRAAGERLFAEAHCASCHVPELRTGTTTALPWQAGITIRPYTDLLLHDLGEDLADGRPDYLAGGREWRTAPLWGIGASARVDGHLDLLHDGRARNVTEAILWHGGEAEAAREAFRHMPKSARETLLEYVESL